MFSPSVYTVDHFASRYREARKKVAKRGNHNICSSEAIKCNHKISLKDLVIGIQFSRIREFKERIARDTVIPYEGGMGGIDNTVNAFGGCYISDSTQNEKSNAAGIWRRAL